MPCTAITKEKEKTTPLQQDEVSVLAQGSPFSLVLVPVHPRVHKAETQFDIIVIKKISPDSCSP